VNLGNALDAPNEGDWGVTLSESNFKVAKAAGFDHVRLPVRFSTHAETKAPYTIDETFFKRVDWAIEQAKSQGLAVILDIHHYEEMENDPIRRHRGSSRSGIKLQKGTPISLKP